MAGIEAFLILLPVLQGIAFQPIAMPPQDMRLVTVTAYSSSYSETDLSPTITASNKVVKEGYVAVNGLRFGAKILLPELFGEQVFEVQDRKNRRYNSSWVDIWMPSRQKAKNFGIQRNIKAIIL